MGTPLENSGGVPAVELSPSVNARCVVHPNVEATFRCRACGRPFCETCGFKEEGVTAICTECTIQRVAAAKAVPTLEPELQPVSPEMAEKMSVKSDLELLDMFESPADWRPEALNAARTELKKRNVAMPSAEERAKSQIPDGPKIRAGAMCVQHPKVQATAQCRICGAFMCATCDFVFPDNLHFCPSCVSKSDDGLSPQRKKALIWSLVLAGWSTVGMTCLVSGALSGLATNRQDQVLLGWVLLIFVLGPAITGLTLGINARRKGSATPTGIWVALVWNAILVVSFGVLMIIGQMRRR